MPGRLSQRRRSELHRAGAQAFGALWSQFYLCRCGRNVAAGNSGFPRLHCRTGRHPQSDDRDPAAANGPPPQSVPGVDRCTNPCGLLRLYCSRQSSGSRGHGLSGRGGLPYQKRRLWGNVHCCLAQFVLCGGSDYAPAGAKCLGADSASFALIRSHFRGLRLLCLRCFLPKRGRRNPCPLRRNPAI